MVGRQKTSPLPPENSGKKNNENHIGAVTARTDMKFDSLFPSMEVRKHRNGTRKDKAKCAGIAGENKNPHKNPQGGGGKKSYKTCTHI